MGIIANYQYLSDKNLKEMKLFYNEAVDDIEYDKDGSDDMEIHLGMYKMWDALHFVLTGVSKDEAMENNHLSEAVFGVNSIKNSVEYIAYTQKSKVKDIVCSNPSSAGWVVIGKSNNGWVEWKDMKGNSIEIYRDKP